MKIISLKDYNPLMGTLIDVRHPEDAVNKHINGSINIYADKLILNHSKYLDKNKTYYIYCDKGYLSGKVIRTLSYYGYDLVQVKK